MEKCAMSRRRQRMSTAIDEEVLKRAQAHKDMTGEYPDDWGMEALRREVKRDMAALLAKRGYTVGRKALRNSMDKCERCLKPVQEVGDMYCSEACEEADALDHGYDSADEMYDELAEGVRETERMYDPYRAVDNPRVRKLKTSKRLVKRPPLTESERQSLKDQYARALSKKVKTRGASWKKTPDGWSRSKPPMKHQIYKYGKKWVLVSLIGEDEMMSEHSNLAAAKARSIRNDTMFSGLSGAKQQCADCGKPIPFSRADISPFCSRKCEKSFGTPDPNSPSQRARHNRGRPLRSARNSGMFSKTSKQLESTIRRGGANATAAKRELVRRAKKRGK